uniref:Uncharacterized protein n=1 Tax=Romanomermis culicivorax TaxID=13658 RepID=A0A915L916_ROMCU
MRGALWTPLPATFHSSKNTGAFKYTHLRAWLLSKRLDLSQKAVGFVRTEYGPSSWAACL